MISKSFAWAMLPALVASAAVNHAGSTFDYDALSLRTVGAPNTLVCLLPRYMALPLLTVPGMARLAREQRRANLLLARRASLPQGQRQANRQLRRRDPPRDRRQDRNPAPGATESHLP